VAVADRQRQDGQPAVLRDSPVPVIPTIRIGTGPDVGKHLYEAGMGNLTYPAIVKPAGWCGGGGVNLADSAESIRGLATLAQGGDTTLVAQPYLGDKTIDYRIYMIGGKPYPYCLRRTPLPGSPVSNASRGGLMDYPVTPPELVDAAESYFATKLPIPFYCIDFLHDGERFWFSEIEPDGVICPTSPTPSAPCSGRWSRPASRRTATATPTSWRWANDLLPHLRAGRTPPARGPALARPAEDRAPARRPLRRPRQAAHLDEVAALPPLVKDDLNVALANLKPRAEVGATWLFQSGGSTGARRSATPRPASTCRRVDHWKGPRPRRRVRQRVGRRPHVGRALPRRRVRRPGRAARSSRSAR